MKEHKHNSAEVIYEKGCNDIACVDCAWLHNLKGDRKTNMDDWAFASAEKRDSSVITRHERERETKKPFELNEMLTKGEGSLNDVWTNSKVLPNHYLSLSAAPFSCTEEPRDGGCLAFRMRTLASVESKSRVADNPHREAGLLRIKCASVDDRDIRLSSTSTQSVREAKQDCYATQHARNPPRRSNKGNFHNRRLLQRRGTTPPNDWRPIHPVSSLQTNLNRNDHKNGAEIEIDYDLKSYCEVYSCASLRLSPFRQSLATLASHPSDSRKGTPKYQKKSLANKYSSLRASIGTSNYDSFHFLLLLTFNIVYFVPDKHSHYELPNFNWKTFCSVLLNALYFLPMKTVICVSTFMSCGTLCRTTFKWWKTKFRLLFLSLLLIPCVVANSSPRFVVENSSEIVVHLKEGPDTPVGTVIAVVKGFDPDGDRISFGILGTVGKDLLDIRTSPSSPNEAQLVLKKLLDRELVEEYQIILSLTDGKLGDKFITQSLLLLVEDVNDNEPIFEPFESAILIEENSKPQVLATLTAKDRDEGPYGQVVYSLSDPEEKDMFSVRTVNGVAELRLDGKLDYERKSLYQLKILAVDRSPGGRINTGTAALVVEVKDVEDMNPTFINVLPVTRIPEDIPVNSYVLQVNAIDGDRGINNKIRYRIVEGDHGFFELDPFTGFLSVKQPLDREYRETGEAFFIKIKAEEMTSVVSPAPSAETEVTVVLEDVNDQTPTFRASHYIAEVAEGAQFNMPVSLIGDAIPEVYDNDQGINGTFRLEVVGGGGMFDVTPSGGLNLASFLIRVSSPSLIDYERIKEVNFTVIARETVSENPKSSSALVTVHITDTNDNVPEFSESIYEARVPENSAKGTVLLKVQAHDPDSGIFGTAGIRYTDIRGPFSDKVNLNSATGEVTLKESSSLDRESFAEFFLTVEARDANGMGNRNSVGVRLIVEDVNDNPPIFLQKDYQVRIFENQGKFSKPLIVMARDADLNGTSNHEVRYAIVGGNDTSNFSIDSVNGVITLQSPLDFEAIKMAGEDRFYNLTIKAYDLGTPSLSSLVQVLVYVADVNDHTPKFERLQYQIEIPEDTPGGTSLLQVYAYDQDGSRANSKIAYRIEEGAKDKFVIEADTGEVLVAKGAILDPDRTEPRTVVYHLTVMAVDGGIGSEQKQERTVVIINILDVNNKPPVFFESEVVRVAESEPSGTFITRVEAFDPDDTHELRYSIDSTNSVGKNEEGAIVKPSDYNYTSAFDISAEDGIIRLRRSLDREQVELIRLVIVCEDIGAQNEIPQTATTTLTFIVEDTNDNDPLFRRPFYLRSVAENAERGTTIVNVVAEDIDKNKTITYSLQGVNTIAFLLHLDNETGEVLVRNKIDREQHSWLNFTVRATDSGFPPRSSFVDVFIQVLDENDNNPSFENHSLSLVVREDAPIGTAVVAFKADDPDAGDYGKVTYLLDRRSSEGYFKIDGGTGEVTVAKRLNREDHARFDLIVEAWDNYEFGHSSGDSRNAFTQITITVADVNDEVPVIKPQSGCSMITEFHDVGDVITVISATDGDDPATANGRVLFNIVGGNENHLFNLRNIDITSAEIFAVKPLVGFFGNYTLLVTATDMGIPPNSVQGEIAICVNDFNDHPPKFVSPYANVTIRVPENATVGSLVIRVRAVDEDVGSNGAILYRLKRDAKGHFQTFAVDQVTGAITLAKPLDREKQKKYNIRVEAYDQGLPTSLSSDLDLTIYVRNINDFEPQFTQDVFTVNFTEHKKPGTERVTLPDTDDLDELDETEVRADVCYFILSGNVNNAFFLDNLSHQLTTNYELDREVQSEYNFIVKATEDCFSPVEPVTYFDPRDDTLLRITIYINDINDNPPKFNRSIFSGGITTSSEFGHEILRLFAFDPDVGLNAKLHYYMEDNSLSKTLSEGLDDLPRIPFIVDKNSGGVKLNFLPQQGMKGYFDFEVFVNDTDGNSDRARVFIYLLREDQRVKFILRMSPEEVRNNIHYLRESLSNVTGAIVNVDAYRVHENSDGSADKTKTDLFLHLVNNNDHSVLEVTQVLAALDKNVDHLDSLFKELNVLETQGAQLRRLSIAEDNLLFVWLVGVIAFLSILLIATVSLCLAQRARYSRQLKAATATAFGSQDTGLNRSSTVPNTNLHSVEGSNPIWMSGFDNDWFKEEESLRYQQFVHQSDTCDSLDNNAVDTSINRDLPYLTHSGMPNPVSREPSSTVSSGAKLTASPTGRLNLSDTYRANLYQTFNKLGNPLVEKKLETTEL